MVNILLPRTVSAHDSGPISWWQESMSWTNGRNFDFRIVHTWLITFPHVHAKILGTKVIGFLGSPATFTLQVVLFQMRCSRSSRVQWHKSSLFRFENLILSETVVPDLARPWVPATLTTRTVILLLTDSTTSFRNTPVLCETRSPTAVSCQIPSMLDKTAQRHRIKSLSHPRQYCQHLPGFRPNRMKRIAGLSHHWISSKSEVPCIYRIRRKWRVDRIC